MDIYMIIAGLVVVSIVPGIIAVARGSQHRAGILALGLLTGWSLIGFIAAFVWACIDAKEDDRRKPVRLRFRHSDHLVGEKTCPQCAELIKAQARVCRFCGETFVLGPPRQQACKSRRRIRV